MGSLRLVGSLKLYVSFAKESYKRNDILQKRPIILRSLLIVATPYTFDWNECICNTVVSVIRVILSFEVSHKKKKIGDKFACETLTEGHYAPSQHTAAHCNTLQHAAADCNILQ